MQSCAENEDWAAVTVESRVVDEYVGLTQVVKSWLLKRLRL